MKHKLYYEYPDHGGIFIFRIEFWIGLRWVTQNRDFVWLGGRKPVFFKWAPNEPNCFQNATSTIFVCAIEENCVIINVKEGWNTAQCLQPRNPICMTGILLL